MSELISLDTNIVLRAVLNDVPKQANLALKLIDEQQVYITDVVLIEVVFVLEKVYRYERAVIEGLLRRIITLPNMVISWYLPDLLPLYARQPALSIVDCYAATETRAFKNELQTFDKKLAARGGSHVKLLV
jgi:predicted nucleic-acid-binding protein